MALSDDVVCSTTSIASHFAAFSQISRPQNGEPARSLNSYRPTPPSSRQAYETLCGLFCGQLFLYIYSFLSLEYLGLLFLYLVPFFLLLLYKKP